MAVELLDSDYHHINYSYSPLIDFYFHCLRRSFVWFYFLYFCYFVIFKFKVDMNDKKKLNCEAGLCLGNVWWFPFTKRKLEIIVPSVWRGKIWFRLALIGHNSSTINNTSNPYKGNIYKHKWFCTKKEIYTNEVGIFFCGEKLTFL